MDNGPRNRKKEENYHSFLLRLWRVIRNGKHIWLAGLEDPYTGKRKSFASLEELISYLKEQIQNEVK
jgi:hypothetical protein